MNILAALQNKKLGIVELLSISFSVYIANLKDILAIYSSTLLPFQLLFFILLEPNLGIGAILGLGLTTLLVIIAYFGMFLSSYAWIVGVSIIAENYVQGKVSKFSKILKSILSRIWHLINLSIQYSLTGFLLSLLLVIPGIIYGIRYSYIFYAFILRDQKGKAAFAYSRLVVKGNWWKVFFFGFLTPLAAILLQIACAKVLRIIPFLDISVITVLSQVLSNIISVGFALGSILLFLNLDYWQNLSKK